MDLNKVQAIVDWQAPNDVKDLRSLLGFANYHRKFIIDYLNKEASLIRLFEEKCPIGLV